MIGIEANDTARFFPDLDELAIKGEVVAIDRASKKISIKLGGTVAPSDTTAPTPFKIQDARMFDAVKPGDKVSFTAEREDGVMTIKEITKE
jgi:Cu(I)/Ag(I) efflux system periplasmic protein CusF